MKIWVDADGCPLAVREILFRAAARTGVRVTLVANQPLPAPRGSNVSTMVVPRGFDVADSEIVRRVEPGDLVVTADIPLASDVIDRGAHALTPRGRMYTEETVREARNMRDFMDTMRASGVETGGGPAAFGQREKQAFANQLDAFLARHR